MDLIIFYKVVYEEQLNKCLVRGVLSTLCLQYIGGLKGGLY